MSGARRGLQKLLRTPVVSRVRAAAAAGRQPLYLTGGCIRDLLLGRAALNELDLTLPDPSLLLRRLRRERGETAFLMDRERATWRLVLPAEKGIRYLDLTRLRAPAIEEDLRLRDFTVNALAVDLGGEKAPPGIIDPTGGLADLAARRLRTCSPGAFRDDPLRALRGIRFACTLSLSIEPGTLRLIRRSRTGLAGVSAERVRDELFRILGGDSPEAGLRRILSAGLLGFVGPPFQPARRASLPSLHRAAALLGELPRRGVLRRALDTPLEQGVTRRSLFLLAAFVRDRGAVPSAGALCRRLALGKKATALLAASLSVALPAAWPRRRAGKEEVLELFHRADAVMEEVVLLHSLLLRRREIRRETAERFLDRYRRVRRGFLRPPLLTGSVLIERFAVNPGPELGRLLEDARRAQDLGLFRDLAGALQWARSRV